MSTQQHRDLITALEPVASAHDLEGLIDTIVGALEAPLQLWHASLAVLVPERAVVRLLAAWSRTDSAFEAGTEVATAISPKITKAVEILATGDAVIVEMGTDGGSLVDHLMQQQGVAAALGIPVSARDSLFVLTLGSSDPSTLHALGNAFCLSVASLLHEPLASAHRAAGGPQPV
jgi:hypothetical protein